MKFKCNRCGFETEIKKPIKKCPKCGYTAGVIPVKLDFEKEGDYVKIIQTREFYKTKEATLKELEIAIATEEEKIQEAKTNINILKQRIAKVKKL